jgi:hypothetical protein
VRTNAGWVSEEAPSDLGEALGGWVEALAAMEPVPLRWPDERRAAARLARYGVSALDRQEVRVAWSALGAGPSAWLLARLLRSLEDTMGDEQRPWVGLPTLPRSVGPTGRLLPIALFLLAEEAVLAYHRRRGVPPLVSQVTLSDLGRHVALHRQAEGTTGVDVPGWLGLHLRGLLYECGRLQYELARWPAGRGGDGPEPGEAVLSVHIPAAGPLWPAAVEASLAEAADFFARFFPTPPRRLAVCGSWLLDEQLAAYLPEDAHILRFQRRFHLLSESAPGDEDVKRFVFRRPGADPSELVARSRLERAVLAHWRSGGHFRSRVGWLALPAPAAGRMSRADAPTAR